MALIACLEEAAAGGLFQCEANRMARMVEGGNPPYEQALLQNGETQMQASNLEDSVR
jgi:hypothetical protein